MDIVFVPRAHLVFHGFGLDFESYYEEKTNEEALENAIDDMEYKIQQEGHSPTTALTQPTTEATPPPTTTEAPLTEPTPSQT